jgi:hypothetical protein
MSILLKEATNANSLDEEEQGHETEQEQISTAQPPEPHCSIFSQLLDLSVHNA